MRSSSRTLICCSWALLVASAFHSAVAADAPKSLVSLVPSDAGLCVELDNLSHHGEQFQSGEFFRRLEAFPPVAEWTGEYSKPVKLILDRIASHLGESTEDFLKKIFGHKVVLSAWSIDGGKLDEGPGLLLLDATDADLLARTIDTLSQGMHADVAVDVPPPLEHAGLPYRTRTLGDGESQKLVYMTYLGSIGVMTNNESVMHGVLELYAGADTSIESVGDLSTYREAQTRVPSDSSVKAFINPRRWNAQRLLTEIVDSGLAQQDDALRRFVNDAWKASDYWITGIQLGDDVRLHGFLHLDLELLDDAQQEVLASLRGEPTFLDRVPRDAILASTGNVDFVSLVKGLVAGRPGAEEGDLDAIRNLTRGMLLGLDLIDEVLPALGPEFGVYLVPEGPDVAPAWVAGIQTRSIPSNPGPSVGEALQNGFKTFMNLAAGFLADQGQDVTQIQITTTDVDGVDVTSLDGVTVWPQNVVATVAAAEDFVMVGTSRSAVIQSLKIDPKDSLGQCERFLKVLGKGLEHPSQIVYIDCRRMREVIANDGDVILDTVVRARRLEEDMARRSLEQLDAVISLSDHLLGAVKVQESGIAYCVTFTMDEDEAEADIAGDLQK